MLTVKIPWWARLLLTIGLSALVLTGYVYIAAFRRTPIPSDKHYVIVHKGATLTDVVTDLQVRGIIMRAAPVLWVARLAGIGTRLKAGGYRLDAKMSPFEILRKIESGKVDLQPVTIPEGFTIRQIGARLQSLSLANVDRFCSLAYQPDKRAQLPTWVPPGSLEGFLFPETYLLPLEETEEKIILRMLQVFESSVLKPLANEIDASPLNLKEVVTLASLVEREARVPEERALIAGVLMNRLKKGMRLECDATVQYALGAHKKRLFYVDLEIDSPYNTYRHAGLPPGPIANPGLECIKAALQPADTPFLFYVAKPDGRHVFSRTLQEHRSAVRRIRAMKG